MRRPIVLVCAGALLTAAVAATLGSTAAATAGAASGAAVPARGHGLPPAVLPGQDEAARAEASVPVPESVGVAVAASNAARHGIDWADCPADWGLARPSSAAGSPSRSTTPSRTASRSSSPSTGSVNTGTKEERQGALVYNPGGPGGSGMRSRSRITTKNPLWAKTAKAYDFVGFDPRGVGHSAPISCIDPQEFVKAAQGRPGAGQRGRQARPAQARRASTPTAAPSAAAGCCRT